MCSSDFFDIDLILAESEHVPVEVLIDCYNLDTLESGTIKISPESDLVLRLIEDPTLDDEGLTQAREMIGVGKPKLGKRCQLSKINDLPKFSKIKIPYWLTKDLLSYKMLRLEPVGWYSESFRKILLADPTIVDLGEKSQYFYEFGAMLAQNKDRNLGNFDFVAHSFFERMKELINLILHLRENEDHNFLKKLTNCEQQIFNKGREEVVKFGSLSTSKRLGSLANAMMNPRKQLKIGS